MIFLPQYFRTKPDEQNICKCGHTEEEHYYAWQEDGQFSYWPCINAYDCNCFDFVKENINEVE